MIEQEKEARDYIQEKGGAPALRSLSVLSERLKDENQRQNLVANGSLDHIWIRHFADSAQLLDHVPRETRGPWLDLGSGAGFPGLVLAILRPDIEFVLIESRRLRVEWLERMSSELGLENCRIKGCRLEQVTTVEAGVISARAFAPLAKLLLLSARFSTDDTRWVLPKGRSAAHEVQELPGRESKMFHVEQSLTDQEAGIVVGRGKVREKA
ncbi:16S rRNA (guanine(527)-N(7))-methyltransferase RsmG [Erythrobacter aquimaris]|uniref:Ribosomal RNA small subunit methyltransferase G n=1 Tax=Qipengyuania aquimaris TaxID=255984 RepID=A0A6I4TQQ8_9SPHN|nr:16S rRNA (guanine(527)-N(7))-methyltransferase RsmG [Qipengyuania aquimaris]MXO96928.1 16S rRNA (guanine(527)-N(7))-methyltransferase RsmG [Qipengyuania aquimaris]